MTDTSSVLIIGTGLAGLVAAYELTKRYIPVTLIDQEPSHFLGGQAFWSLGGIFCVNSSDQRSNGIQDNYALAMQDWLNTAKFDRDREDRWPKQWAEAFVKFAETDMERYLKDKGIKFLAVGWAERGAGEAGGHGNSLPRFHLTWGTGPAIVDAFAEPVLRMAEKHPGLVTFKFRHQVDDLVLDASGSAIGVRGKILEPADNVERGAATSRVTIGDFEIRGKAVLISTGGIGGNIDAVKRNWPVDRLGPVPSSFVVGVPAHVDGRGVQIAAAAGGNTVNMDRMWHYTEGLANWNPIWPSHGIRVIPGPSSLWLDATGKRLPAFLYPGCDTLATLKHICSTGHSYTWFILNRAVISREFSLSGSEQNPDITGKSYLKLLHRVFTRWGTWQVQDFMKFGEDFVVEQDLDKLVEGMNRLAATRNGPVLELDAVHKVIHDRDVQTTNKYTKDAQVMLVRNARTYKPDARRIAKPAPLLNPADGPLIAVRMNILTRKSLGGLETDLEGNVLRASGEAFKGLYAAGEASGFGGGGMHGYSSLEGTFLGGCIFSGLKAGKAMADLVGGKSETARL